MVGMGVPQESRVAGESGSPSVEPGWSEGCSIAGRGGRMGRDWEARGTRMGRISGGALAAALLVLFAGCAPQKAKLSDDFVRQLDTFRDQAGLALLEAMDRQREPQASAPEARASIKDLLPGETVWVQSGKSQVIRLPGPARRVSIGNPDLAGIVVVGPSMIVVNGKPLPEEQLTARDRGAVRVGGGGTFLGRTLTREPRVFETTLVVWRDGATDIHPLIIADFLPIQVLLEVTVAEVNRTALEQHGIDFRVARENLMGAGWMGGGLPPFDFSVPKEQPINPLLPLRAGAGGPQYAFIFPDENATLFLRALQTEGMASILAQPKIMAMSGQNAVFQVGGEIPIRVSSGFVAEIDFKPFGTLVNFIPRVTDQGDIFLTVTPEVSEADFAQTVEGIPTFRTRRASTTSRLRDGETLVIGGLLQTKRQEEVAGVPYLKDIPYLGYAFRTTRYIEETSELMVVVKPSLVHPLRPGSDVLLPTDHGPLTREEISTEWRGSQPTRPRLLPSGSEPASGPSGELTWEPAEATDPELPLLP